MRAGVAKYLRIWLLSAAMSMQAQLTYRLGSFGFLLGKTIRVLFFFAFVAAVFDHVESVAGYTLAETALFFLTFNLVDMAGQILFRGVYGARRTVADGDFDFHLVQPCSPLFRLVFSTVDFLDVITIIPVIVMTVIAFLRLPPLDWHAYALYTALLANGLALTMAIHVLVAGVAVRTQEMESAIWIYRNVMFMGKFPAEIYRPAVRWGLTVIVPVAVMTSFPAQAALGRLSPAWIGYAFALTGVSLAFSAWFWTDSLARYTSSSS